MAKLTLTCLVARGFKFFLFSQAVQCLSVRLTEVCKYLDRFQARVELVEGTWLDATVGEVIGLGYARRPGAVPHRQFSKRFSFCSASISFNGLKLFYGCDVTRSAADLSWH